MEDAGYETTHIVETHTDDCTDHNVDSYGSDSGCIEKKEGSEDIREVFVKVSNYCEKLREKTRVKPEQFAVIKLNGDKVPELITLSNSQLFFFCYKKGKIRQIGNAGLFTSGVKYFPGRQLLKNSSFGGVGVSSENYIQINVKKQKTADCCMAISGMNFKEYYIQGRQVSRSSYSSYVKKLVGSVREKEIRFIQNTKKNRKRYLK